MQRLYMLQQRMRRMPMFCAPVYSKLRPVERDFCEVRPATRAHPVPDQESDAEDVPCNGCKGYADAASAWLACNVALADLLPPFFKQSQDLRSHVGPASLHVISQHLRVVHCALQLTEIKALLGAVGELRFVLGCISQLQDGRFFLEDLSDSLPLDLSAANTASGFFTGMTTGIGWHSRSAAGVLRMQARRKLLLSMCLRRLQELTTSVALRTCQLIVTMNTEAGCCR